MNGGPEWRTASPYPGCSIFTTSAPWFASITEQKPPVTNVERSRTFTPSSIFPVSVMLGSP